MSSGINWLGGSRARWRAQGKGKGKGRAAGGPALLDPPPRSIFSDRIAEAETGLWDLGPKKFSSLLPPLFPFLLFIHHTMV